MTLKRLLTHMCRSKSGLPGWPFSEIWLSFKLVGLKIFVWPFEAEKVSTEEKYYCSIFSATYLQNVCNISVFLRKVLGIRYGTVGTQFL